MRRFGLVLLMFLPSAAILGGAWWLTGGWPGGLP